MGLLIIVVVLIFVGFVIYVSSGQAEADAPITNPTNSSAGVVSPIAKSRPATLFIPFVRGVSASMSDQFVDHGGRTGSSSTTGIANDLTATVMKYEAEGYEFQKIETVHVDVSPGCIGMLMGKGKEYHPYDYLVFKKSDSQQFADPV